MTSLLDFLFALWWITINALLLRVAWRISLPFDDSQADDRPQISGVLLCTVVLFLTMVLGSVTAIGAIGWLTRPALVGGFTVAAIIGSAVARYSGFGRSAVANASLEPLRKMSPWNWIWALSVSYLLGHMICNGLLEPPRDFDSLAYHIPLVDFWLQNGSLCNLECKNWFLPANNEVLGAWFVAPFSGDFLIGLSNLPIALLFGLATYRLCQLLGLGGNWAHAVTLATILVHPVWRQTTNAANDLAVVAYFLAAACYSLQFLKSGRRFEIVLCGLCVGLLVGVKYYALGYGLVIVATLGLALWKERRLWSISKGRLAGFLGALLFAGGYWYARNAIAGRVPMFPLGTEGGHTYQFLWQSTFVGNTDPRLLQLGLDAVQRMAGPWHLLAVVCFPAIAVIVLLGARNPRRSGEGSAGLTSFAEHDSSAVAIEPVPATRNWIVAVWLIGSFLVLLVTPFAIEDNPGTLNQLKKGYAPVRYGLCFLSIASISQGLVLKWISDVAKRVRVAILWQQIPFGLLVALLIWQLVRCLTQQHGPYYSIVDGVLLGLACFLVGLNTVWWFGIDLLRRKYVVAAVFALLFAGFVAYLSHHWHNNFDKYFDSKYSGDVFAELHRTRAVERICVLDRQVYPFFGSRRQHWVTAPRSVPTPAELIRFARAKQITMFAAQAHGAGDRFRGARVALENAAPYIQQTKNTGRWIVYRVSSDESLAGE